MALPPMADRVDVAADAVVVAIVDALLGPPSMCLSWRLVVVDAPGLR